MPLPDDSFIPEIARTIYGQHQEETAFGNFITVVHGDDDSANLMNEIAAIGLRIQAACRDGLDLGEGHSPEGIAAIARSRLNVLRGDFGPTAGSALERLNQIRVQLLPFAEMAASFQERRTRLQE